MKTIFRSIKYAKESLLRNKMLILITVAIFVVWEVGIIISGVSRIILPRPSEIYAAFQELIMTGRLQTGITVTMLEWAYGLALSCCLGIPIALAMGISDPVEKVLDPYVSAFISLPSAPLLPLLIIWFGLGINSSAIFVLIFTVFQLIWLVKSGVKNVRKYYVEIGKVFGASSFQIIRKIIIPASMPMIFEGLRLAVSRGLRGVIVGELLFITTGLGYVIYSAGEGFRTDIIFALLFFLLFLSITASAVVKWVGEKLFPWRKGLTI